MLFGKLKQKTPYEGELAKPMLFWLGRSFNRVTVRTTHRYGFNIASARSS